MDAAKAFTKFCFSESANNIVEAFSKMYENEGAEKPGIYRAQLVKAVMYAPRKGYRVDGSDNYLSFAGIPFSWLRDWKNGEIHIMTLKEAKALDAECSGTKGQLGM